MALRLLQDAALKTITALPAQNTTAVSGTIDTGQALAESQNEKFDALLTVPATPSLAAAQTLTFTFQDSADGVTFNPIPELATLVVTGNPGPASTRRVKLPPSARRYLNITVTASATAGNNTAVSYTFQLVF